MARKKKRTKEKEFDFRKMIECSICKPGVMFNRQDDYQRHMEEFHPYTLETEPPKGTRNYSFVPKFLNIT